MDTVVAGKEWNVDDIVRFLTNNCPTVEMDDDTGEIILYTGLYENEDGELILR